MSVAAWICQRVKSSSTQVVTKSPVKNAAGYSSRIRKPENIAGPCLKKYNQSSVSAKKFLIIFLPLLILAISSVAAYYWFKQALSPVSMDSSAPETTFIVAPNEPAGAVITDLMAKSLIRSPLAAKIYLRVNKLGGKLRPGGYSLSPAKSASEIFTLLTSGPADVRVTIPEGWRREQIAARLASLKQFQKLVIR